MILLSIGYSRDNRDIYDRFKELCGFFKDKSVSIALAENDISNMHYLKCILKDTEKDLNAFDSVREMFYSYSSNIIYDYICVEYISDLLDKLLKENYNYLTMPDIDEIKHRTLSVIAGTGIFSTEGLFYSINCKNTMLKKISDYLQESSEIIMDGFVTFRLRDINDELNRIVEKIVEDYVIEKEYSEFIKLLKYFVEIQESRYDTINIIVDEKGEYTVEDEQFLNITKEFFEDFNIDNIKGDINKNDILVSALITCAPKKVVVHGAANLKDKEVMDTIKNIFNEKMIFCTGCERCKNIDSLTKM